MARWLPVLSCAAHAKSTLTTVLAIHGCKLPSNPFREWIGTRTNFERKAAKMERAVAHLVKAHA
jgi:hypothetical protein